MPRRDQTGPMSEGKQTGKGFGPCGEENKVREGRNREIPEERSGGKVEFGLRRGSGVKRRQRGDSPEAQGDFQRRRPARRGRNL